MAGDGEWEQHFDRPVSVLHSLTRVAVYRRAIEIRQDLNEDQARRTHNVRARAMRGGSSSSSSSTA